MKSASDHPLSGGAVPPAASYEATLRLLAQAPVPAGLGERVQAAVQAAPRQGRLLSWPHAGDSISLWGAGPWLRTAAAAAIVFVVAGGGWGVYRRVQGPAAKVVVAPVAQPAAGKGFSAAGAIRSPQTVPGPELVQPAAKPLHQHRKNKVTRRVRPSTPRTAAAHSPQPKPAPAVAVSR